MTRAVAADLGPIAEQRGPSCANAGLRLERWLDWGSDFKFTPSDEVAFLKSAVTLFKKQSRPDSSSSLALREWHCRNDQLLVALSGQGWHVEQLKLQCAGQLRAGAGRSVSPGDPGLEIHRNLGVPYLPAPAIVAMIQAACLLAPAGTPRPPGLSTLASCVAPSGLMVLDAFPVAVARLDSEHLGPDSVPRATGGDALRPVELLSVVQGAVFRFVVAARMPQAARLMAEWLQTAVQLFGTTTLVNTQSEPPQPVETGPALPLWEPPGGIIGDVVRASAVNYQVQNGRVVTLFRHSNGKEGRAEEHAGNILMSDEMRERLAKKKILSDVTVEVEAVGNAWRVRSLLG